ncbi:hypothetical protein [Siminovitchia fortis]|nr:hypothetical protein [Siminovitchia fortis]
MKEQKQFIIFFLEALPYIRIMNWQADAAAMSTFTAKTSISAVHTKYNS